ncbi:MAG: six-hairpin glycosidase [Dysgonamonadaceae bacterium]|jgi:hypothetical protein|nr:six-hairpin glycosidase [Dysgonamonadaceae bacterium]
MKYKLSCVILCALYFGSTNISAQKISYGTDSETGAISQISIGNDETQMNWILKTDHSQYEWIGKEYGWGLGFFYLNDRLQKWEKPENPVKSAMITYKAGDISITVKRFYKENDLVEEYTFGNTGEETLELIDAGINTPFNDNYPDAETCITNRCNAHIWAGGNAAYVNAVRMGGSAPHLGLAVIEGAIKSYEIRERDRQKGMSNFRGVIILNPENITLKPKESYTLSWRIFAHGGNGWDDFNLKLLDLGGIQVQSDRYVYEKGERAAIQLYSKQDGYTLYVPVERLGENRIELVYNGGKKTNIDILCISSIENLIEKRINFIIDNQQYNNPDDSRDGAYLVYDNETDRIYLNDAKRSDCDEGRERLGMGVLLAKYYQKNKNEKVKHSLLKYAEFVRTLQRDDYTTFSTADHKSKNRGYNYPWVAEFYFEMYQATGDKQFAIDGYETMQAMYRQFGYGFYAIHIPVRLALQVLKQAGMTDKYEDLKTDFLKTGDIFVQNGLNYPKHEVNYEQSIVAPSVTFLAQLYLETGISKYLDGAKHQLPALESFNGRQPSYHLNEIAVRHWDGYWFGKRKFWGDTFPHYWSALTGEAFHYYSLCTGDTTYQKRAENIVRNNLSLFSENGKASCAYLYPCKVNGIQVQFYDEYANDQDWALVSYFMVNDK